MSEPRSSELVVDRFLFEALIGCAAQCSGCGLEDKTGPNDGLWSDKMFDHAVDLIAERQSSAVSKTDFIKANMGQGDYLALDDDNLARVARFVHRVEHEFDAPQKMFAFSTSGIARPDRFREAVDNFNDVLGGIGPVIAVEIVVDPTKFDNPKFLEMIIENSRYLKKTFGYCVLVMQLGPDVARMELEVEDLYALAVENGISSIHLNAVPTRKSKRQMSKGWADMLKFSSEMYRLWRENPATVLTAPMNIAERIETHAETESVEQFFQIEQDKVQRTVFVDHLGHMAGFHAGLSEIISANPASGFWARNISETSSTNDAVAVGEELEKNLKLSISALTRKRSCQSCEYFYSCAAMGGGVLLNSIERDDAIAAGDCPLAWRDVIGKVDHDRGMTPTASEAEELPYY